jgi:hypothetical protein
MNKSLKETLSYLQRRKDWDKYEKVFTVIANLMFELGNKRPTAASYNRTFKLNKLIITVDYKDENASKK